MNDGLIGLMVVGFIFTFAIGYFIYGYKKDK